MAAMEKRWRRKTCQGSYSFLVTTDTAAGDMVVEREAEAEEEAEEVITDTDSDTDADAMAVEEEEVVVEEEV